jgi:DNA processing protein
MVWSSFKNSFNKNLWFIQTHFTFKEINKFYEIINNNNLSILNISDNNKSIFNSILEKIISNKERLENLIILYQKYFDIYFESNLKLISKFEIEILTNKKLHECFPLVMQYSGNTNILKKPLIAIVGSRHPTFYGREQTYKFAKQLSNLGCTIVSGGAIGIDAIANSVALEQNGGSCSILGSGLKNLYPPSNHNLFKKLANSESGLLFSEFQENSPPQKWNFPKRNHTISLLADFVLIIEAAKTSGSLITANAALDFGIDVGVLPGPIDSVNSEGTNSLLQSGAFCIQKPTDVFERVEYIYKKRCY